MTDVPETPSDPAESRAIELLRLVGTHTPDTSPRFTGAVIARARTERIFALPLRALGGLLLALAAAITDAVRTTGGGRGRR